MIESATMQMLLQRIGCVSEFEDRDVGDAVLEAIVSAAAWAPSAANAQPWEIIAVRSSAQKEQIGALLLDSHLRPHVGGEIRRSWVMDAPVLLVICLDRTRAKARVGDVGKDLFGIQDSGAAIQNMRLMALAYGIKSCLVREFDRDKMAALLALPAHVHPLILIAMGYAERDAQALPRLPLEDYLHQEQW